MEALFLEALECSLELAIVGGRIDRLGGADVEPLERPCVFAHHGEDALLLAALLVRRIARVGFFSIGREHDTACG